MENKIVEVIRKDGYCVPKEPDIREERKRFVCFFDIENTIPNVTFTQREDYDPYSEFFGGRARRKINSSPKLRVNRSFYIFLNEQLEKIEKEFDCAVDIYFVSYFDRQNGVNFYEEIDGTGLEKKVIRLINPKLGNSPMSDALSMDVNEAFNRYKADLPHREKKDAVEAVLSDYAARGIEVIGACFAGDSSPDYAAIEKLKSYNNFPIGTYGFMINENNDPNFRYLNKETYPACDFVFTSLLPIGSCVCDLGEQRLKERIAQAPPKIGR